MTDQAERTLVQKLRGQLQDCAGWDGDDVSEDRVRALNYYHQRPRGDEVRGRSNVVSGDVSAMVEANLAQMLESFSGDSVAEYISDGEEDDDQATLESFAVQMAVMQDNNGHQELGTAIKDALLVRNGWIKIWVEEVEHTQTLTLENADAFTIAAMREQPGLEVDALDFDPEARTARVRVRKQVKRFRCEAVDPANILYPRQWSKTDLQPCPFFAERHLEARAELLKRGFPKEKVSRLKATHQDTKTDSLARDLRRTAGIAAPVDSSQDLIEWFECYALVDSGDGTAERKRFALAGVSQNSLLEETPVAMVAYATGSPFINPHRLTGISLFDKLRQVQDLNTGLKRALMDNVNTVIKNRTAYLDGKVNTDDLADGRPNGNIRVRASVGDVRSAIMAFNQPDLSDGILANIREQRQDRTELGGASLELASGQMQMAGGRIGSEGVDRAFSVMEQLAAHMTKNMATSLIRNVFLLAHATMREFFDEPVNVKVNGRWESPVPSQWQPRTRVRVKIGMSPGERARRVSTLRGVVDSQIALAREGMDEVLVNIEGFYRALTDWGRAADLPTPEQYFLDPSTPASKQALKKKQEDAARDAEAQRALMAQAVGLEQLRTAFDKYRHDSELQFKYFAEILGAEVAEAKIVGEATADLVKATKFGDGQNGQADSKSTRAAPQRNAPNGNGRSANDQ
jgi:hypothetical protein